MLMTYCIIIIIIIIIIIKWQHHQVRFRRCVVQLTVLGYVLVPVFQHNTWYVVLAYSCLMLLVAAAEAAGRPSYSCKVCACLYHFVHVCTTCLFQTRACSLLTSAVTCTGYAVPYTVRVGHGHHSGAELRTAASARLYTMVGG